MWAVPATLVIAITVAAPFQSEVTRGWPVGWILGPVWFGAMALLVVAALRSRESPIRSGRLTGVAAAMAVNSVLFAGFAVFA
ncbi:hypothetical protein [Corynebacterium sp.]|uniref:hypothetical protein n=1 Tax=Corynebacterium sp. TaxID=1720 RepID=UPI0026DF967A|nr:hypothetical protein [Corynebacterium sp.]MDO5513446.1 hypothetical protein [Corynebacterium sp.]